METKLANLIADKFTAGLDMNNLTRLQCWILHGIKSVAMSQWAKDTLAMERGN